MVGESLTQMARRKNVERMAAQRKFEAKRSEPSLVARAESSPPIPMEKMTQIDTAKMEHIVDQQGNQEAEHRGEKHPAEHEADSVENLTDKQLCIEESDLVVSFIIQPRIKNVPIASDALAVKDPAVALSMASSISLPIDRATFRAEPDLLIAKIGRRQHDAIEQISFLTAEIENKKSKAKKASLRAESEAMKAAEERARVDAETEKAKSSDQLRLATEERANVSDDALKLAKKVIAKLEADLEASKKAKEIADSEISKTFQAGKDAALENYVEEVPKFENWGFKHGNDLKKVMVSANDAVLAEIKIALQFFGCPNLQKQGRSAHILLRYEPTYAIFSAANNIPISRGKQQLMTFIFPNFKNLRQIGLKASDLQQVEDQVAEEVVKQPNQPILEAEEVDEALNLAFEEADLNRSNPPSTSGRGDVSFEDIFTDLGDLPGTYPENMAGELLTQLARRKNAERMATQRRVETNRSEPPLAVVAESSQPNIKTEQVETVQVETTESEQIVEQFDQEAEQRGEKHPAEREADPEEILTDKQPCLEESNSVVPFIFLPRIKNVPIASDASTLKDPAVALSGARFIVNNISRSIDHIGM
ncbi:uncharacterized protein LOC114262766 [Camellia sinensis]|uniref:uncharacterized protein LOC114262766 n=1 Tax=Camellia sinensis TaxID=4442 RepID=UPI00103687A5|nr:uncharacterized protein LOC114262766 [Camellia sinensis]